MENPATNWKLPMLLFVALGFTAGVSRADLPPPGDAEEFTLSDHGLGSELPSLTHLETLNDLVHEVPRVSWRWDRALAELSAVQELAYLHERQMRGEGLPDELREGFSDHYSDILRALVEERVTEAAGRELLCAHRLLLQNARTYFTQSRPVFGAPPNARLAANASRDQPFVQATAARLKQAQARLVLLSQPGPGPVPVSDVRTPLLNGHQAWVEELLAWSCHCRSLSGGDIQIIRNRLHRLENAERSYKSDGRLTKYEREQLHRRLIELQRAVVEAIRD